MMDIDSQLHLHGRVNKVSLYSTIQSLSVPISWTLRKNGAKLKKNFVLKFFILYKENCCIKKILIINFLSAIYGCFFFSFLLCKHSSYSHLRNNVSVNNGVKYLPFYHKHSYLNWVLMWKNTSLSEIEIFVVFPPCPMMFSLQPNNVPKL